MPSRAASDEGTLEPIELCISRSSSNDFGFELDGDLVTWDSPKDPANPQNWNPRRKMIHVVVVSVFTFAT